MRGKKKNRLSYLNVLAHRKGASTLDYIVVIAAALLLALILYFAMGDTIKPKLETVIPKIIRGEQVEITSGRGDGHSGSGGSFGNGDGVTPGGHSYSGSGGSFDNGGGTAGESYEPKKKKQVNKVEDVDASHRDLRHLSELAYFDVNQEDPEEWAKGIQRELEELQMQGLIDDGWELLEDGIEYNSKSDFAGMAFRNRKTGEIAISFRGTHEMMHFVNDAQIFFQLSVSQKKDADKFIKAIADKYGKDHSIVLTGHSFAGFLAQDQSVKTGYPAITFNAVGMKPKPGRNLGSPKWIYDQIRSAFNPNQNLIDDIQNAWGKYDDQIVNFVDKGDPIGNYGVHYGKVIITGGDKPKEFNDYSLWNQHRDNLIFKIITEGDEVIKGFPSHGLDNFDDLFDENGNINY